MAILTIYSVHDVKVGAYGKPFCEASDVIATRGLNIVVNDKTTQLAFFPEDFNLYKLGKFDEGTAKMELLPVPEFVVSALSQVKIAEEMERISRSVDKQLSGRVQAQVGPNSAVEKGRLHVN